MEKREDHGHLEIVFSDFGGEQTVIAMRDVFHDFQTQTMLRHGFFFSLGKDFGGVGGVGAVDGKPAILHMNIDGDLGLGNTGVFGTVDGIVHHVHHQQARIRIVDIQRLRGEGSQDIYLDSGSGGGELAAQDDVQCSVAGVDDGAMDLEMALVMMIRAKEQGVLRIIVTPHSEAVHFAKEDIRTVSSCENNSTIAMIQQSGETLNGYWEMWHNGGI